MLEALVGAEVDSAAQQQVERGVKILLSRFQVSGAIILLAFLVIFLDLCDQIADGVNLQTPAERAPSLEVLEPEVAVWCGELLTAASDGACALAGGKKADCFWTLWQEFTANEAPNTIARDQFEETLIVSKAYRPLPGHGRRPLSEDVPECQMVLSLISLGQFHDRTPELLLSGSAATLPAVVGWVACGGVRLSSFAVRYSLFVARYSPFAISSS